MATIITDPRSIPVDATGTPYRNARRYVYQVGTLTPLTTYSDSALTTAHAVPQVADANGVFAPAYLPDNVTSFRRRLLQDGSPSGTDGALISDIDNIPASSVSPESVGGALYRRTDAERSTSVTPTYYAYPPGDVRRYGAIGDGSADDTAAFQSALATTHLVYVPHGTYKITASLTLNETGMVGEGWGTSNDAKKAKLVFYNLTSSTSAAIKTDWTTYENGFIRLENLYILASSWDPVSGCQGYGLDVTATVLCRNAWVGGFRKHNLFLHNTATDGQAPYNSLFENFVSQYAGEHGIVVGTGANSVTFINAKSQWCGAPSYLTAPSVAGNYDGLFVARDGAGNPSSAYFSYLPESLTVIGGDFSYNSRYGVNVDQLARSHLMIGYAEGNLQSSPGQIRLGSDMQYCLVHCQAIQGGTGGVNFAASFATYQPTNTVIIGGQHCGSGNSNTETSRSNFWNANKQGYFAHSSDLTKATYFVPDTTTGDVEFNSIGGAKFDFLQPIYRAGTQVVNTRQTGWAAATGTATRTTFDTATVTTTQLAERVKALVDDLIAHGLIGS